jgi:hypothetical protein
MVRWTAKDGSSFWGRFLGFQGTAVVILRDGFEFAVPASDLSPASVELVSRLAARARVTKAPATVQIAPVVPVVRVTPIARAVPFPQATPIPRATPVARAAPVVRPTPIAPIASIDFGPQVLAYCKDHMGEKIGSGECGALAARAIKNAGAAATWENDLPKDGDPVWGTLVASIQPGFFGLKGIKELGQVEPGDIVQFHHTRFSGYNHAIDGVYRMETPHHTAVIESVSTAEKTMTVLHQNWNGQKVIRRQTLYLRGMTSGWLRFYRPSPEPPVGPVATHRHLRHATA